MPTAAAPSVRDELYRLAPEHLQHELRLWIERGIEPNDNLLFACLRNDLGEVVSHVASEGGAFLEVRAVLMWLWNTAPPASYGSIERCKAWRERGGEEGAAQ